MPRKSTDSIHINLRIRESLREKLETEAKKNGFSLNTEIRVRLEKSFEAQSLRSLDESVTTLANIAARFALVITPPLPSSR